MEPDSTRTYPRRGCPSRTGAQVPDLRWVPQKTKPTRYTCFRTGKLGTKVTQVLLNTQQNAKRENPEESGKRNNKLASQRVCPGGMASTGLIRAGLGPNITHRTPTLGPCKAGGWSFKPGP